MDSFEDDDILFVSDDESPVAEVPCSYNPVDDHLIEQLNNVRDCIQRVKNETINVQSVTKEVIRKLTKTCTYFIDNNDDSSGSDCELFDANYEPVVKKKKFDEDLKVLLHVGNVWQRIIDDQWVVGVELQNLSNRVLEKPKLYIMISGQSEIKGVTSFWETVNESLWSKTCELDPMSEKIVGVTVLDLPNFQDTTQVKAFGTVMYTLDGRELQTPISCFSLNISQAVDKSLTPRYATNRNQSVLAMKATSFEKVIIISLDGELGRGIKLLNFLQKKDFCEILPDVHISKNSESLRHCIFEFLSVASTQVILRISARSIAQLNIMLHMLLNEFPDAQEIEKHNKIAEAAITLEKEFESKLECDKPIELLIAKVKTDLLMQ
ncbi:uncharacterized protein [Chelonus insularis]|uniref:uncharacterized protein n=1 Tax=Chelonus insularis TaxID=460826 RepID=UPI00158CB794|nr:uncharacterized protein LOC118072139 [Chelonus insularis]